MNLLIHNATIFTNVAGGQVLKEHAVVIEGTRVHAVAPETELRQQFSDIQTMDAGGRLMMPGLINAHMHFYATFARGLALPEKPKNFADILRRLWWRLDSSLDSEAIYFSALIPAITAVKHGVTAVIDHHASPNAVSGSLDRIEEALDRVGIRAVLCYEVSDRDGKEIAEKGLQENVRYIEKCRKTKSVDPDHLFDAMIGLHASFTLDDDTLRQAAETSRSLERGCHIHVLEDEIDREETKKKYGMDVVERMLAYGILGEESIAAHAIHINDEQVRLLADSDTIVVHNPQSNMNNAVGRSDIFRSNENGILTGLGTDGMSASIFPDVRMCNLLHKHDTGDPNIGWDEIANMTLRSNPCIFERVSGQKVGKIAPGYLADLILVDYFPPTPLISENFWGHFLFGIADAKVNTTIINGRVVMRDGKVAGIDEEKIAAEAVECAKRVWQRFAGR